MVPPIRNWRERFAPVANRIAVFRVVLRRHASGIGSRFVGAGFYPARRRCGGVSVEIRRGRCPHRPAVHCRHHRNQTEWILKKGCFALPSARYFLPLSQKCPVVVPKISMRHLSRRNFDHGHSLTSLYLPLAALGSLPQKDSLNLRFKNPRTLCPFTNLILYTTRSQNTVDFVLYDVLTFVLRRCR